jgi:NAD(P)-dependent dehydrogenase (short-subunit alcohol dehydrogenase family)
MSNRRSDSTSKFVIRSSKFDIVVFTTPESLRKNTPQSRRKNLLSFDIGRDYLPYQGPISNCAKGEDMKELQGKVAFITGGAAGIGLGMAQAFIRAGMKVAIADIRRDHLDEALAGFGGSSAIHGIQMDVTDRKAMEDAADEVMRVFGKVHILCNNTGVGVAGPLKLATYDDWDWVLGVALGSTINGICTFLPRILAQGEGGHIVNTSSMAGILPHPGMGLYNTAKFAVVGLSESLREELATEDVGVSVLCPGPINTKIHEAEKTRPARFANSGLAETTKVLQKMKDNPLFMDPAAVGEMVLDGILENKMYILTHSEFGDGIRSRNAALEAAIPPGTGNPELRAFLSRIVDNPVYKIQANSASY